MLASVAEEEPGGCSPSIDNEVNLEGLVKDIGRFIVIASDRDTLGELVEGRVESVLDGFVELHADESFAVGPGV